MSRTGLPSAFFCAACGIQLAGPFREWPAHCGEPAEGVFNKGEQPRPLFEPLKDFLERTAKLPPEEGEGTP